MWLILTEGKPCGTKDCEYSSRQACHHQWQVRPPYGSWGPCLWYINHKLCLWEDISPSHDFFIWKRSINLRIIVKTSWGNICRNIQHQFRSVQPLSSVQLFATPWIAAHQASLSITNSRNSHRLMSIESVMPSSHLILCRPLLLVPPIPPSIRVFSNESTLRMRWKKYWSFSFSIIPSKEIPGLISFRMDWLDLLAVQGTLNH